MSFLGNKDTIIEVNILENRYVTDGNVWTIDTTIFNSNTQLFMIVNLKTRAILGYVLHQEPINEDLLIELYEKIFARYNSEEGNPILIHSDMEPAFSSEKVIKFLKSKNIKSSTTAGGKNQNQVSEAINNQIKTLVAKELITKDSKALRNWRKVMPSKYKGMTIQNRAESKDFRKLLFISQYFTQKKFEVIPGAISAYNKRQFSKGISREEAEFYNSKLVPKNSDNFQLVSSQDIFAKKIDEENKSSINKVRSRLAGIINSDIENDEKLTQIGILTLESQNHTNDLLKRGFNGIATQNVELLEQNEELRNQITKLQEGIQAVSEELAKTNEQKMLAEELKVRRKNRNKRPKREPITRDIYDYLISQSEIINYSNSYRGSRLRLALTLLSVTGVRISELLPLKMHQVKTLFSDSWIAVDRAKKGPVSHKAFLTREGSTILRKRRKDFEIISYFKSDESFIFTAENSSKPLEREAFNRAINGFIKSAAKELENKPTLTSHSFRIGFITQLWKDTNDIEFVRQTIGHAKIDTTSQYVEELSEEERKLKMNEVKNPEDLLMDNEL